MTPKKIQLHKQSGQLELQFADGKNYHLSAEYLRVFSPSAEVKGHSPDQAVLQHGKKNVLIDKIATVGNYAIQLFFDDGHASGIYSWQYLKELCDKHDEYWQDYLQQLKAANKHRDKYVQVLHFDGK